MERESYSPPRCRHFEYNNNNRNYNYLSINTIVILSITTTYITAYFCNYFLHP